MTAVVEQLEHVEQGAPRPFAARHGRPHADASPQRRRPQDDRGVGLSATFDALLAFPALAESRTGVLAAIAHNGADAEIATAIESDAALILAVLRLAREQAPARTRVDSIVAAVQTVQRDALQALVQDMPSFDLFERAGVWGSLPGRFRVHALATQTRADMIADEVGYTHRDRLAVTSFLHDIGRLALLCAYPNYPAPAQLARETPERRLQEERRVLVVDHALVGAVLMRHWGLPESLARAIERHHDPEAEGDAAFIRLADLLVHYEQGAPVLAEEILRAASAVGLTRERLRALMCERPGASRRRARHNEPCPLSPREQTILKRLARGVLPKQIALELGITASCVRTHLRNIYSKLGAVGRAQAVLIAHEGGWV
jgi:putative nucleotidyltransferase with HDIG domain